MAKPVGPICNLDCAYCYYLAKERLYPGSKWRMGPATLDEFVRQYIDAQPAAAGEIVFGWQGGEPTLLEREFFEEVVRLQQRLPAAGPAMLEHTANQWRQARRCLVRLVQAPRIPGRHLVGRTGRSARPLSPRQTRPAHLRGCLARARARSSGTRSIITCWWWCTGTMAIMAAACIGSFARPACGICNSSRWSSRWPQQHGRPIRSPRILVSPRSVLPEQWGEFLVSIFDEWVHRDVGQVFVQIFDESLASWLGREPSLCVFRRRCGRALAIEHNGDVYSCDHFVEPEYRLGNIHELPLVQLAESPRQRQFGEAKEATLPEYCRQCDVRFACHGECPKNRILHTPEGEPGLNYLRGGYQQFFRHIDPAMRAMAAEVRRRASARRRHASHASRTTSGRRSQASGPIRRRPSDPARNDPCPAARPQVQTLLPGPLAAASGWRQPAGIPGVHAERRYTASAGRIGTGKLPAGSPAARHAAHTARLVLPVAAGAFKGTGAFVAVF